MSELRERLRRLICRWWGHDWRADPRVWLLDPVLICARCGKVAPWRRW